MWALLDPPLVVVDLVPEARCVCHCEFQLQALLLDDCGGRAEGELGLGGAAGSQVGSLTVGH